MVDFPVETPPTKQRLMLSVGIDMLVGVLRLFRC
jgi:hypothetical protein